MWRCQQRGQPRPLLPPRLRLAGERRRGAVVHVAARDDDEPAWSTDRVRKAAQSELEASKISLEGVAVGVRDDAGVSEASLACELRDLRSPYAMCSAAPTRGVGGNERAQRRSVRELLG